MPTGNQIARVDPVVITETQVLDFVVAGKPQLVSDVMTNSLAEIILQHRKDATTNTHRQKRQGGGPKRGRGVLVICARRQHRLGLVDGMAK